MVELLHVRIYGRRSFGEGFVKTRIHEQGFTKTAITLTS
jgi:hypothetical protein